MWLFISWVNLERIAGQLLSLHMHQGCYLFIHASLCCILPLCPTHPLMRPKDGKYKFFPLWRQYDGFWGGSVARLPWLPHASHLICCMAPTLQWSIDELILFVCFQFIMTAVSVSLPIPAGVFFPVFLIGKTKLIHLRLSNIWQFGLMQSRG